MEKKLQQTDKEISKAFQDINQLMDMAKPMVGLAKSISNKIKASCKWYYMLRDFLHLPFHLAGEAGPRSW